MSDGVLISGERRAFDICRPYEYVVIYLCPIIIAQLVNTSRACTWGGKGSRSRLSMETQCLLVARLTMLPKAR